MDFEINIVFFFCGYVCFCENCLRYFFYCFMCKIFIIFVQRIYVQFLEYFGESDNDDDDGYDLF